jgi:hypothetical protein
MSTSKNAYDDSGDKSTFDNPIVSFLSHLIAIPVFIVLHKILPNPEWKFHLDRILLLIVTVILVEAIFQLLKPLVLLGFICSLLWLTYGSFFGEYGFKSLFRDYRSMIYSMANSPHPEDIILSKLRPFPNKSAITGAIDFDNPEVRNFALSAVKEHFSGEQDNNRYRTIIQCFSVFREINPKWTYVSDPKSREYFAKASESIKTLAGDCDDHSILMAACIRAIGGTPRLIHTTGHIYPELLIGTKSDLESINYIVKKELFSLESSGKKLVYHIDNHGQVWLNLDYTAKYPGGPLMSEEILGALTIE